MPELINVSDGRAVKLDLNFENAKAMMMELSVHPEMLPKDGLYAVNDRGGFRLILKHGDSITLPTFDSPI